MVLIATIRAKIVCGVSEGEVIGLYNSLIQGFSLDTLSPFGLTRLLEALSHDDAYQLQALSVFSELERRGSIDSIALKSVILSNACVSESATLVSAFCPHIAVEDRLKVLLKPFLPSAIRYRILESVTKAELARAMKFAAENKNDKLFDDLLKGVEDDKRTLTTALSLLKTGKCDDRFKKKLLKAGAENEIVE